MKKLSLLIMMLCWGSASLLVAQNDSTNIRLSTIKWNAYEYLDSATNSFVDHESYFITHGEGDIEWFQKEGEGPNTFSVHSVSGTWNDVTKPGAITFEATLKDAEGKIIIKRDGDWITVKLIFRGMRVTDWNYTFSISSFEIQ